MSKNIRIKDIAAVANVSPGTVDRVLHKRGKVSKEKKERVEKALKEMAYKPNIIARSLATNKEYDFAALIPFFEEGEYWEKVSDGIKLAEKELKTFNVRIGFFFYDQYDEKSIEESIEKILAQTPDGVLISTLFGEKISRLSIDLDALKIPYIFIDALIPKHNNLAYFGSDSYSGGKIAAQLILKEIDKHSDIVIANYHTGMKKTSTQIKNRENGFRDMLEENNFGGKIHTINYSDSGFDNPSAFNELLAGSEACAIGCIAFNSQIYKFIDLIETQDLDTKKLRFVGYDTVAKNIEALKKGKISFLISQRAEMQGHDGIMALANHLIYARNVEKTNYMPIDILIKENIDYYNNYKLL